MVSLTIKNGAFVFQKKNIARLAAEVELQSPGARRGLITQRVRLSRNVSRVAGDPRASLQKRKYHFKARTAV